MKTVPEIGPAIIIADNSAKPQLKAINRIFPPLVPRVMAIDAKPINLRIRVKIIRNYIN
jgi:hypothetical protein